MSTLPQPIGRRRVLALAVAALGAAVAGCTEGSEQSGDDGADGAAGNDGMDAGQTDEIRTVIVGQDGRPGFHPEELEVPSGTTVRWQWASDRHTVTPETVPGEAEWSGQPEPQDEGTTYEHTFDAVGVYQYYCDVHRESGSGSVHVRQQPDAAGEGGTSPGT